MQNRTRGRQYMYIGIGVVGLVLIVGFVLSHLGGGGGSGGNPGSAQASSSESVVVALQPIPQGTIFKAGQPMGGYFGIRKAPSSVVPAGAYTNVSQITNLMRSSGCGSADTSGCVGQITAAQAIFQNSPIVAAMFSQLGQYRQSVGPAFAIPYGYVAIAVSLSPVNAVYGSIAPGDDVDIIASYDPTVQQRDPSQLRETQYVLNDIRVISVNAPPAVGDSSSPSGSSSSSSSSSASGTGTSAQQAGTVLILLVKYQQALIIQHLKDFNWTISMVLRSAKETDILHFRTDPVTNKWYFSKGGNPFWVGSGR